jgi:transmembrane sensor
MNEPQPRISKAMVFAYFAHQATPIERQQIEGWLKTQEGVQAYFTYLDEWERQFSQFQPDLEEARSKFRDFVLSGEVEISPDVSPRREEQVVRLPVSGGRWPLLSKYGWWAVASFFLFVSMALTVDTWYYHTWKSRNHEVLAIRLKDGSQVELGANSSLKSPRFSFGRQLREVWLEGEASFNVVHKDNPQRFKVYIAGQAVIEVLGTEFVVNTRPKTTKVILKTGSIKLSSPVVAEPLMMKPGELVTISARKEIKKELLAGKPEEFNWKVRDFEFHDTSLQQVINELHEAYGVNVSIGTRKVGARTVSGTFQAENAEDLLEAISDMMNLKIEEVPDGYVLR